MQHNHSSDDSVSRRSAMDNAQSTHVVGFTITHQDADILKEHLDNFKHAKTGQRADIIERAMAEIFEFQKPDPPFDKKEASKVFCVLFVCLSPEF
jgi:hypothetical protein